MSYRDKNEKLNAAAAIADVEAQDPAIEVCLRCGQTFDTRKMGDVHHHAQPTHQPMLSGDASGEINSVPPELSSTGREARRPGYGEGTFDQQKHSNSSDTGVDGS